MERKREDGAFSVRHVALEEPLNYLRGGAVGIWVSRGRVLVSKETAVGVNE